MASTVLIFSASLIALFLFSLTGVNANAGSNVFSMQSYGARGDGLHDDTKALRDAWAAACSSAKPAVLLIPKGKKYLNRHTILSGPCKSNIVLMSNLMASPKRSDWSKETIRHWILISGVTSLTITGGGTIDGNGKIWWQNSCKTNSNLPCTEAPMALTLHACKNLKVEDLKVVNSQQIQISVEDCTDVKMSPVSITAPETSPNTDDIHITRSRDVQVMDCTIKTGDDCMSIQDRTENLHVNNMVCGPRHGISIGSLGDHNSEAHVSNVTVDNGRLYGTTNGARIKTWQGGKGSAKNIVFQNMKSAVEVSDVLFKNIRGTSASEEAIMLHCSSSVPCHGITLEYVKLTVKGGSNDVRSTCQNAEWKKSGSVSPQPCSFKN
uniref:Polygalacturonase n=1 Tax=Oryza brachyantha TaxID=4533 RepID=J3MJD6_ORYBR